MKFITEREKEKMTKHYIYRWGFFLMGLMIMSLGISMTIKGQNLGVGPWDVLHVGLYEKLGLSIGTWNIITGFIIISSVTLILREWPNLGTWINMTMIGLFVDLFYWLLSDVATFWGQVIIFMIGIIVMGYGAGIYVSPAMGAGPRDSLMLLIVEKYGISVKAVRTTIELIVAIVGWLLGGPIGIGTVLIALLIGQIMHYAIPQSEKVLLKLLGAKDRTILS